MNSKPKRICITGAGGNLGGLTARYLLEHTDYELNLMFHKKPLSQELISNERTHAFRCDLGRKETLVDALKEVDEIIHFAGVLFRANPEKFLPLTNLAYFENLLEVAQRLEVKRITLIIGRVAYYGDTRRMQQDLLDQLRYPTMKHAAEIF